MSETISNITEASAAVIKGQPRSFSLSAKSGGGTVFVDLISWTQFNDIYNELAGPLGGMFGSQANGTQLIPGAAMVSASTMTQAITALVRSTPKAIEKLVIHSASVTEDRLKTWFWADLVAVGMEAFKLNFLEQDQLIGFFAGIGNALSMLSQDQSQSDQAEQ